MKREEFILIEEFKKIFFFEVDLTDVTDFHRKSNLCSSV